MENREDDEDLVRFLAPAINMWKNHADHSYGEACQAWQQELDTNLTAGLSPSIQKSLTWILFNTLLFHPIKIALAWLQKTINESNVFEKRTLGRLKRFGLLQTNSDGQTFIHPAPIDPAIGKALLLVLTMFTGLWAGWIVFGAKPTLMLIFNSTVFGIVIGSLNALVMDFSYNQQDVLRKLNHLNGKR